MKDLKDLMRTPCTWERKEGRVKEGRMIQRVKSTRNSC